MTDNISKEQWIALFREIGLTDAAMQQWHRLFEQRHQQGHQGFLEWLGLPAEEIRSIREWSRQPAD